MNVRMNKWMHIEASRVNACATMLEGIFGGGRGVTVV